MYKCYSVISPVPNVATLGSRTFMYESYSKVRSIVDKTKWIPEASVLSSAAMQPSPALYDGNPSLDGEMPLSRQRGLDPAVISTSVRQRQSNVKAKIDAHNQKVDAERKVQEQLNAIENISE